MYYQENYAHLAQSQSKQYAAFVALFCSTSIKKATSSTGSVSKRE